MKIVILLLISLNVFANDNCVSEHIIIDQNIEQLAKSGCSEVEQSKPCSECAPPLIRPLIKDIKKAPLLEIQEKLLKVSFDEYKKVLISNIVDIAKTRSLPNSKANFSESKLACKAKTEKDFPKGCNPKTIELIKKNDLFGDFNKRMANEIATIVSKKTIKERPTLLPRTKNACFIPEQTLLQISATTLEETFNPKFISILQKIPKGKYKSVSGMLEADEFYDQYGEGIYSLTHYMRSNPLLRDLISTPDKMIDFFHSVPSPITTEGIKAQIYNEKNSDNLDQATAKKCNESFTALTKFICSESFSSGDVDLEANKNFTHLFEEEFISTETPVELYATQKMKTLKFCTDEKTKKSVNLTEVRLNISKSLEYPEDSIKPLSKYQGTTYQTDFSSMADLLCKDEPCPDMNNIRCRFIAKYKEIQKTDSYDSKLANSSNDEVNSLLRSMIGAPEELDASTREVLVAEGILPDSAGKVASTSNIPERQPGNFGLSSNGPTSAPVAQKTTALASGSQNTQQTQTPYVNPFSGFADSMRSPASVSEVNRTPLPDFSDIFEDTEDLKRIQDEIKRRLMGGDPEAKPKTIEQAKKVVRDSMNALPKRPTYLKPNTENMMAQRLLQNQNTDVTKAPRDVAQDKAASAAQQEKWEQELQNRAVSNMAGVRAALEKNGLGKVDPASGKAQAKKDLTKVALNIPDDPKVNLTEVFGKKYNGNDPETQVLKVLLNSQNDFLLQINSLDFKVVFDETKKFRVLLQTGDTEEASRIRPQLELFLKRLNEKKING